MIEILLKDIKPVSINIAYATARNGGRFNTKKYCEFLRQFNIKIYRFNDVLSNLDHCFNDEVHELVLALTFYLPKKRYFTTKNKVSLRSGDASNFIKTTEDALFKRFNHIDDANVKSITSTKEISEDDNFNIGIKIYTVRFKA